MAGYQYPASGNAYCGIITYELGTGWREYVGSQIISPLIIGTKYFISLKACLSNKSVFASNNLGVLFSTIPLNYINNITPFPNHAMMHGSLIISDSLNWNVVSGTFIADSAYQYIIVGNFFDDNLTDTLSVNYYQWFDVAYYYIDDICVSPDSLACDLNPEGIYNLKETKASINLYPNPATQQLIINNGQLIIKEIEITNSLGAVVYAESGNLKS